MKENFGEAFEQVLNEKNITIYKLSQMTGISTTHLYRIRDNENEPSFYVLNELSSAVGIDLQEYYKIYTNFNSLVEYEDFLSLRELIEGGSSFNADGVVKMLKGVNVGELKEGIYKQLYFYALALVETKKNMQYSKSLEICFSSLGIANGVFKIDKIDKYITSEVSFAIINLIEYNYFFLNKQDVAIGICEVLISIIENNYMNSKIIILPLPKIVFRAYISAINNIADSLYSLGEYEDSVYYCEKGIGFLNRENSIYNMVYLLEIMFQCKYELGEIKEATTYYYKTKALCMLNEDKDKLRKIEKRVEEKYTKILLK